MLSNATKFTNNGTVTLKISSIKNDESDYLVFDIIDTGTGIPDDEINNIFDEYSQVKSTKSTKSSKFAGSGLGLPISRKLARIMGGDITVASKYGEGSTFTVQLPVNLVLD